MTTLFVSDVHLSAVRPATVTAFENFLRGPAREAEALYILGDCFDLYLGDDDDTPPHPQIVKTLRSLTRNHTPVFFQQGNHDFLAGQQFCERSGCTLLEDAALIEVNSEPVLVMHGDTLCTDDSEYQAFRAYTRQTSVQREFLSLPLPTRREKANHLRQESQRKSQLKPDDIMDVNEDAVADALRKHNARYLVHGHTHRPEIHDLEVDGKPSVRIVLGDWYEQNSVLRWGSDHFALVRVDDL